MEKSSKVMVTFGNLLSSDTCALPKLMSPSMNWSPYLFMSPVRMEDDNTSWIVSISTAKMPATHAAIFNTVLFIVRSFVNSQR